MSPISAVNLANWRGLIKKKKKEYYEDKIDDNKENPTDMWKTLKELIRGEPAEKKESENIYFEGLGNVEGYNVADKFNWYYINSINDIVQFIDEDGSEETYIVSGQEVIENFKRIEIKHLQEIIMGLPRKKGTEEEITSDILKAFDVIKEEFVNIINSSLEEGNFPEGWKTATIVPIPKVERTKKASEFRPINMLPMVEKVLELVVKKQIEAYLENNYILTEHQSGFRRTYSCEIAIQTVIDEWKKTISEGKMVGVIFIDFKRAFETVDRGKFY